MIWYKALFSFHGRLNRQGFWIGVALNFAFLFVFANIWQKTTAYSALYWLPLLISTYSFCAVSAKRLHDRDRSTTAVFMVFVPVVCYGVSQFTQGTLAWLLGVVMPMFIGTILIIEWGFFKGNPEGNRYGERGETFSFR